MKYIQFMDAYSQVKLFPSQVRKQSISLKKNIHFCTTVAFKQGN